MKFVIPIFVVAFGLIWVILGVVELKSTIEIISDRVSVEGKVVGSEKSSASGEKTYRLTFEFSDWQGRKVNIGSEEGYSVGDQVSLIYERNRPENAKIDSFLYVWGQAAILLAFGIIIGGAGVGSHWLIRDTEKTFEKSFFAHNKKNLGKFRRVEASIDEVFVDKDPNGNQLLAFSLSAYDKNSGRELNWQSKPTFYKRYENGLKESQLMALKYRKVKVTFDPDHLDDYFFDISDVISADMYMRKVV